MLRGGLVGFGRMGVTHFALLNTHPEVQWAAVCDSSSFTVNNLKRIAPVAVMTDHRKLLDQPLDFVVVATPTADHTAVLEAALARRLHVFVEKPLATTAAEADALAHAAADQQVTNQVGYFLRFNEVFELVHEYLVQGAIGRLVHYKNEMYGRTIIRPTKGSWRTGKRTGGGCALDYASHCVDLTHYLFGPPVRVDGCVLTRVFSEEVEDAVYATLVHENGLSGHLLVNWSDESFRRPYNRIEVVGTQGRIVADRQELRLYLREPVPALGLRKGWTIKYLPELVKPVRFDIRGTEFTRQLDHFVDCMRGRTDRCRCTFSDASSTDRVLAEIKRQAGEEER